MAEAGESVRTDGNGINNINTTKKRKKGFPSPRELVAHYESQGMDTQDASLRVIQDLQGALFKVITTARRKSPENASAKLDAVHSRLLSLESKLDSKPSYPQAVALGVASAGIWNAVVQLWGSVKHATSSSSSHSS